MYPTRDPWWDLHIPPGISGGIEIPCRIPGGICTYHLGSQLKCGIYVSHAGSQPGFTHSTWDLRRDLNPMQDPWWNLHIPPGILVVICLSPWIYPSWELHIDPTWNFDWDLGWDYDPPEILGRTYTSHLGSKVGLISPLTLDLIFIVTFVYPTQDLGGFAHAAWDLKHNFA